MHHKVLPDNREYYIKSIKNETESGNCGQIEKTYSFTRFRGYLNSSCFTVASYSFNGELFQIYEADVQYNDLNIDGVTYKFGKSFHVSCQVNQTSQMTYNIEINTSVEGERENDKIEAEMALNETPPNVEHGRCTGTDSNI